MADAGKWKVLKGAFLSTDHVYFETSASGPYQIRRIEELNKVSIQQSFFSCVKVDI